MLPNIIRNVDNWIVCMRLFSIRNMQGIDIMQNEIKIKIKYICIPDIFGMYAFIKAIGWYSWKVVIIERINIINEVVIGDFPFGSEIWIFNMGSAIFNKFESDINNKNK